MAAKRLAIWLVCVTTGVAAGVAGAAGEEITAAAGAPRERGPFGEQTRTLHLDVGARVHINWPGDQGDADAPAHLILYSLPNGNTIEQTVGCQEKEGLDWHFYIQHIGAQTRRLREIAPHERFVIAYLEAEGRSWPAWKRARPDYRTIIPRLFDQIVREAGGGFRSISLAAHSGGGSLLFGLIDSYEQIPSRIERIAFLDANYGYDDAAGHGDKLIAWLRADERHVLSVICYDDGLATLNGKFFLSAPDRGTWGATGRMLYRFIRDIPLTHENRGPIRFFRGLDGRVEFILHTNPENRILHTALVGEMSGFLHAMTLAGPCEREAGPFAGPVSYGKWIQPEPLVITTRPSPANAGK